MLITEPPGKRKVFLLFLPLKSNGLSQAQDEAEEMLKECVRAKDRESRGAVQIVGGRGATLVLVR